jgi:hypothetical protein
MRTTTIRRVVSAIAVTALLVPASASARPVYDPPIKSQPTQDLRSPDTRDVAGGRLDLQSKSPSSSVAGTTARPEPQPVVSRDDGVDWPSLAIGAALFGGLVLVGFGIATMRRVRPRPVS